MMFNWQISIYVRLFRLCFKRRFLAFGKRNYFICPSGIEGAERISIGNDVYVAYKSFLAAVPHTKSANCRLSIEDGTRIGRFNHIYATSYISIGKNVLTANSVYIADNTHQYLDPEIPIAHQPIRQLQPVHIGDGSWLGHNVCVLGANIGKQCVVGANSVVTKDIPDFCVAVGSPAVIVRRFDPMTGIWRRTTSDGIFLTHETRV